MLVKHFSTVARLVVRLVAGRGRASWSAGRAERIPIGMVERVPPRGWNGRVSFAASGRRVGLLYWRTRYPSPPRGSVTVGAGVGFGEVSFNVAISLRRFPNGGSWSFFLCPCGRRARTLRLFEGGLACRQCLGARGLRPRVQLIRSENRAAYHAPRILARLNSDKPARLHPRSGRKLDRRVPLEARLRRSLIVAKQFALDEHDKTLRALK